MKKQILIFMVALIASVTVAWGQGAAHDSNPNTFNCTNDALHPIAGKPYGYQLTASPSGGQYTWYATKATTFVSTTASVTTLNTTGMLTTPTISAGAGYGVTGSSDVVTITWSSSALANTTYNTNPTFVVGYYNSNGVAGICADNLKIYQLDPKNGFIVDIKAFDDASLATSLAYGANSETQCFDKVRGAVWSANQIQYDYGTNYLIYEVVAANFSDEWKPQFDLTGEDTGTQSVTIQWTYEKPAIWSGTTVWHTDTETATTTIADTSTGVSIYVRVTIKNNNYQGISDQALTLAVAGTNKEGLWDVDNTACTQPNSFATASVDDTVVQTLLKRPTMNVGTTSGSAPNTTVANSNAVPQP